MNPHFLRWAGVLACTVGMAGTGAAWAADDDDDAAVAYVNGVRAQQDAYLITWYRNGRAHVVGSSGSGSGNGTVSMRGDQRVITLDQPISTLIDASEPDACGDFPPLRQDTLQIGLRTLSGSRWRGTSAVALAGQQLTLSGCDAGQVVVTGSLDQPAGTVQQLALRERPSVQDLRPGTALAGPSEQAWDDDPAAGVLTLQAGGLGMFADSGHVVGAAFNEQGWLVLSQPTGSHGYIRLSVDSRSGAEVWLDALWTGDTAARVRSLLMTKPLTGAGFGTVAQASRVWESGLFAASRTPFYAALFQDGSGVRVLADLDTGSRQRNAIRWNFSGANIEQTRPFGSNKLLRTWVPLRNGHDGSRLVLESELTVDTSGGATPRFPARVNIYIDRGAAVPPGP